MLINASPANVLKLVRDSSVAVQPAALEIGQAFLTGMLLEIGSSPKPGLVCLSSAGAHKDMNFLTFMAGTAAIAPAVYLCAQAGLDHDTEPAGLLVHLRAVGREYERKLMTATRGINTQRGILFAAGVLCGAAGLAVRRVGQASIATTLRLVSEMTTGLVARELEAMSGKADPRTAGERLYLQYGVTGIRGEVEAGFPSVTEAGLPALREALARADSLEPCLVHTLLSLMSRVQDTTIIWRQGPDALKDVQARAEEILRQGSVFGPEGREAIVQLDRDLIAAGISPGGSADLLAVTVGLYLLENKGFPVRVM